MVEALRKADHQTCLQDESLSHGERGKEFSLSLPDINHEGMPNIEAP
jgi:hypothetical protein